MENNTARRTLTSMTTDELQAYIVARKAVCGSSRCRLCRTSAPAFSKGYGAWVCSSCEWRYVQAGGNINVLNAAWRQGQA